MCLQNLFSIIKKKAKQNYLHLLEPFSLFYKQYQLLSYYFNLDPCILPISNQHQNTDKYLLRLFFNLFIYFPES